MLFVWVNEWRQAKEHTSTTANLTEKRYTTYDGIQKSTAATQHQIVERRKRESKQIAATGATVTWNAVEAELNDSVAIQKNKESGEPNKQFHYMFYGSNVSE